MRTMLDMFDDNVTNFILRLPSWVRPFMVFATFVGGPIFTIGGGLLLVGAGIGMPRTSLYASGMIIVLTVCIGAALKLLLRRHRPLTYVTKWPFATFSFPSGHTVGGVVTYGSLAYLAWQFDSGIGYAVAGFFAALTVVIGASRVYLGAHYPSDVVAGWLLGGAGLAVILFIVRPVL